MLDVIYASAVRLEVRGCICLDICLHDLLRGKIIGGKFLLFMLGLNSSSSTSDLALQAMSRQDHDLPIFALNSLKYILDFFSLLWRLL